MICEILTLSELLIDIAVFSFLYISFIYVNMLILSFGFKLDIHKMYFEKNRENDDYVDFISLIITMSFISTLVLLIIALYDRIKKRQGK